jgi:hypothetical protein
MSKLKLNANFAVFVLFFGIALLEAVKNHNWAEAVLFFLLGVVSLWADWRKG